MSTASSPSCASSSSKREYDVGTPNFCATRAAFSGSRSQSATSSTSSSLWSEGRWLICAAAPTPTSATFSVFFDTRPSRAPSGYASRSERPAAPFRGTLRKACSERGTLVSAHTLVKRLRHAEPEPAELLEEPLDVETQ